ncbi:acetate--CoA ligase family protein [Desulfosarcina sp.]|uniref:acetate--CoA ligase family protein n=1 Tax=Desulfosarcina sp. TaxID=2027861 RepID=UPI0035672BF2
MKFFFEPRGIAVVGATPSKEKGGHIIVSNLKKGYQGEIFPVNPRYEEIEGFTCYPSVADVPDPVDLAILFVAAHLVPPVIEACAKRKIPGVMIQSAGFSEIGTQGEKLQQRAKQIADRTGIRLWGPNCMGLVDARRRFVFSTVTPSIWDTGLTSGNVSLIAQSGMLAGAFLIDLMSHGTMGISKVCSIGNKMDVDENDILEYLIDDPDTTVIGLYLESFVDCRRFMNLARGTAKPIVILNGGKTARGAAAALSHTASLSANGVIVSGAMAQAGIVEAGDFYQLSDYCKTLGLYPEILPQRGNRVAVLTYTGAAGIVSTDIMDKHGLVLSELDATTLNELKTIFPEWMPPSNPVDMWPGIILNGSKKVYGKAIEAVCADPGVDAVFAHCFAGGFSLETDLEMMAKTAGKADKPLFCWISGEREQVHEFQVSAQRFGIPVFREIVRAVECIGILLNRPLVDEANGLARSAEKIPKASTETRLRMLESEKGQLDEYLSKKVLAACDIPVVEERRVSSLDEALQAANHFGFPLVAKGIVQGVSHKTESNLIRLGISSIEGLESAVKDLQRTMQVQGDMLIQKQVEGKIELTAGFVRDPQLGPCVMCGLGGIFAEALNDTAFGVAPLTLEEALKMISRLQCQRILDGYRGLAPVDKTALARILVSLGDLGCAWHRIQEIDINPLIIHNGLPIAVDGLVLLSET